MNWQLARVVSGGLASHPESGAELMRILVDHPFEDGGEGAPETELWAERDCPEPATGEDIAWNHRHVVLRNVAWRKVENDRNPYTPFR